MNKKNYQIAVLETGHVLKNHLAAGDQVLERMVQYLPSRYGFKIIIPKIGAWHWQKLRQRTKIRLHLIPKTVFDNHPHPLMIMLAYNWRVIHATRKLFNLSTFDAIYSSTSILPDILPAYLYTCFHPEKIWVAKIHHLIPHPKRRSGNQLINWLAYLSQKITTCLLKNKSDLVLVNNSQIKKELKKNGFNQVKIKVLENGIDWQSISTFKPTNKFNFDATFLGRIHPAKGMFDICPIWKAVTRYLPQARLAVVGSVTPKRKQLLLSIFKKAGLNNNVKVFGYLPREEVFNILKQSRVFLSLDHEAGWGIAIAEAMACGLPVVGWDIGILGNIYQKGFIKVTLGNHRKFATQVVELLNNHQLKTKLSRQARNQASQFDWSISAKKFNQFLDKLFR